MLKPGYKVKYKLFNASDYGVPQKRERVIIMGFSEIGIASCREEV